MNDQECNTSSYGQQRLYIKRTCLYNVDPLEPHFYIVKLGFTGVNNIFLFLLKNIDWRYPLEPPHRGGSNEYLQSMFWAEIWKISGGGGGGLSENFQFLVVKFSIYLNRRVFVMIRLRGWVHVSEITLFHVAAKTGSSRQWLNIFFLILLIDYPLK